MSTRGIIGFVIDGQVKATYNHSDSYPSWLGVRVLAFAASLSVRLDTITERVRAIQLVTDETPLPNPLGFRLAEYTDTAVGGSQVKLPQFPGFEKWEGNLTWYQALRKAQGNLEAYTEAGYMEDGVSFASDSLFCEWGYLVNLDDRSLEVYQGFQEDAAAVKGRFAGTAEPNKSDSTQYDAISLVARYDLGLLPTDKEFLARLEPADED